MKCKVSRAPESSGSHSASKSQTFLGLVQYLRSQSFLRAEPGTHCFEQVPLLILLIMRAGEYPLWIGEVLHTGDLPAFLITHLICLPDALPQPQSQHRQNKLLRILTSTLRPHPMLVVWLA